MRVIEVFMYGRRCAYYHSFLQERKRGGTPSLNFAAAKIGITSVIQPGGSMRDQEVIDAANEAGMAMLFTGIRHFRH